MSKELVRIELFGGAVIVGLDVDWKEWYTPAIGVGFDSPFAIGAAIGPFLLSLRDGREE